MKKKMCTKCKQELVLSSKNFHCDKHAKDGFVSRCKSCANANDVIRRATGRKKQPPRTPINKARSVQYLLEHRKRRNKQISNLKTHLGCCVCGYNRCGRSLHFHHRDNDTKAENIAHMRNGESLDNIVRELLKCAVVCANCHAEIHSNHNTIIINKSQMVKKSTINKFLKNYLPYEQT